MSLRQGHDLSFLLPVAENEATRAGARVGALNCDVNLRMEPRMAGSRRLLQGTAGSRCSRALRPTLSRRKQILLYMSNHSSWQAVRSTRRGWCLVNRQLKAHTSGPGSRIVWRRRLDFSAQKRSHWGACGNRTSHSRKLCIRAGPERVSGALPGTQRTMGPTGRPRD